MADNPSDDPSFPPQSYRTTENLAEELSLSQGEVLRARVVSKLPQNPGKLVVTVRGNRVVAESQLGVSEGQVLLVRVKSIGSPIELELIDPYDAPGELRDSDLRSFLDRTELPSSDEDLGVLREWLNQSLPLDRSLLEDVLDEKSLVQDAEKVPKGNRLWASAFLNDRDIQPSESLVSAIAGAREADPKNDFTLFYRTNEGNFQTMDSGTDLRTAVQSVGFDLVRQFSRRPHRAAGTLHAKLLRKRDNPPDSSRALHERLLGLILGVAFSNLRTGNEFLVFLPLAGGNSVNLLWLRGRVDQSSGTSWFVRGRLSLSDLGTIELSAERNKEQLNVSIRTSEEETLELLTERRSELRSKFMNHFSNVRLNILEEDPGEDLNPFHSGSVDEKRASEFITPGLDLTV